MANTKQQSVDWQDKAYILGEKVLYFSLIALPFVSGFSSALVNTMIGFAIFGLICKIASGKKINLPHLDIILPFALLILWSFVSFSNSINIKSSFGGINKLLKYTFLALAMCEGIKDRKHLKLIIISLMLGLFVASVDAIYQLYVGVDIFANNPYDFVIGLPRLRGAFPHTNLFGGYMALFASIPVAVALYYANGKKKVAALVISALVVFCLFFTFSRSAVLGFCMALLFMAIVRKDKLILFLVIAGLIASPLLLPGNIKNWVKTNHSFWEVMVGRERVNIYRASLNMIKAHPIVGVGTNTFCLNFQKYKAQETDGFTGDSKWYAHNIYLHTTGEIGLVGLALFLWLFFGLFKYWAIYYKLATDTFVKVASLGAIAGVIAFLINGLTESNLYYSKIATMFFFIVGLLLGIFKIIREKRYE